MHRKPTRQQSPVALPASVSGSASASRRSSRRSPVPCVWARCRSWVERPSPPRQRRGLACRTADTIPEAAQAGECRLTNSGEVTSRSLKFASRQKRPTASSGDKKGYARPLAHQFRSLVGLARRLHALTAAFICDVRCYFGTDLPQNFGSVYSNDLIAFALLSNSLLKAN